MHIFVLTVVCFVVALIYSSIGLGGGSSYTALLVIAGTDYKVIPVVSLILNILVSSLSSYNFIHQGHARMNLILPFLLSSIPMSYFGGALEISETVFLWILWISLIVVAVRIYLFEQISLQLKTNRAQQLIISIVAGGVLGFIGGSVGIGGGIYLIPLILVLGLGNPKEAATAGALFVLINSISGLVARLQYQPVELLEYIPLIVAVVIGGVIGSYIGATKLKARTMEKLLGITIIIAIVLSGNKLFGNSF
ncbi:TSUP family transporter [Kaarinaea lacus]